MNDNSIFYTFFLYYRKVNGTIKYYGSKGSNGSGDATGEEGAEFEGDGEVDKSIPHCSIV